MYLHKFATKYQEKPLDLSYEDFYRQRQWKFNDERFLMWNYEQKHFILDIRDFSMTEISDAAADFLSNIGKNSNESLSDSNLLYLIKNQIII